MCSLVPRPHPAFRHLHAVFFARVRGEPGNKATICTHMYILCTHYMCTHVHLMYSLYVYTCTSYVHTTSTPVHLANKLWCIFIADCGFSKAMFGYYSSVATYTSLANWYPLTFVPNTETQMESLVFSKLGWKLAN